MSRTRNQFFAPGELPLVLLALLAHQARHGYELMAELDRLFGPAYSASAGSVYPAMAALAEEGLIASSKAGPRTVHRLTAAGRSALAKRRTSLAGIEVRTGARLGPDGDLSGALDRFATRVGALAGRIDPTLAEEALEAAACNLEAMAEQGGARVS